MRPCGRSMPPPGGLLEGLRRANSGDEAAQQGIRFTLFHLLSTYSGEDPG